MAKLTQVQPQPLTWPGEEKLRNTLTGYVDKYSDANKNYENLTPDEQYALDFLHNYTGGGPARTSQAGEAELLKTLSGGYDPESSAYYAPVIAGINQNKEKSLATLRRGYNMGGNLTSLSRARAEADTTTGYDAQVAQLMLGLQENERGRMASAVTPALQYGQYVEETPLRKANAEASIGGIPRQLQQDALGMGSSLLTNYRPTYYNPLNYQYFKNGSGSGIGGALGAAGGFALAGPGGVAPGYLAGSSLGGYFG